MGTNGNFTLFSSNSNSGANNASSYLQDSFQDITLPATSNLGLTQNPSTDPLGLFYANDDMPRYRAKTLWIADAVLVANRSLWINNKPTYQIIWSEPQPHIQGYVFGDIRLRDLSRGKSLDINDITDGIAINGVIRKLAWIVNTSTDASANAEIFTDGADQSATVDFSNGAGDTQSNGVNHYNVYLHQSSLATKDIHEYRLVANTANDLNVAGIIAYFENATVDIDCFPGSTYVNKSKITTTLDADVALPVMTGKLGARSVVQKTGSGGYQQVTVETPYLATVAVGSSGTNLLNVTTGQGASFPAGIGLIGMNGSSFYVGSVRSQSTDTLTVSPTLSFGFSGLLYAAWAAGPTFAISASLYTLAETIDPRLSNVLQDPNGFGTTNTGTLYYSHPEMKYRMWGENIGFTAINSNPGLTFLGATLGFLQIDGHFCAAEVEIVAAGIVHGTFAINGIPAWGINEGVSGIFRKTVFAAAGPGRNSFVFSVGSSFGLAAFTKINLYERVNPVVGMTGVLASFDTAIDPATRNGDAVNATLMPLGAWQRLYADHLFLQGQWTRGITYSVAGAVYYQGSSTNSALKFQYYGTDFAVVGTAGTSAVLTLDGASIAVSLNARIGVPTLGFHSVQYSHHGGTSTITALDFLSPQQTELKNEQQYIPDSDAAGIPRVFNQYDTPRNPKDLDIWAQDNVSNAIWIYLFGRWNKLSVSQSVDDPMVIPPSFFFRSHGNSSGTTDAGATDDLEQFNFSSWLTATADSIQSQCHQNGEAAYSGALRFIDGLDNSAVNQSAHRIFNKISWSSGPLRANKKQAGGIGVLNSTMYIGEGSTGRDFVNPNDGIDAFNNTSWINGVTTFVGQNSIVSCIVQGGKFRVVNGVDSGNSGQNVHETYNGAAVSTDTAIGTASFGYGGSGAAASSAISLAGTTGTTGNGSRKWDGATWSSNIATAVTYAHTGNGIVNGPGVGFNSTTGKSYINGGSVTDNVTSINNTGSFNGTSWSADVSSSLSRSAPAAGVM